MATERRTSPEQRAALRARYTPEPVPVCPRCGEEMEIKAYENRQVCWECQGCGVFSWTSDGDVAVLAAVDDADALAGARAEIGRLRAALATIQQWDCLNPPNTGLCEDFPWLRELVDTALAPERGGASDALA